MATPNQNLSSQNPGNTQQNNINKPIVHARGDSDSQLDDLFKVLQQKPGQAQAYLPFSKRNLPPSFFTPPEPRSGAHSRESSTDGTPYSTGGVPPSKLLPGLTGVAHSRSVSSPAQLPHTGLTPAGPPPSTNTHGKSGDFPSDEPIRPLPPGWEMAKNGDGQRYYLKHEEGRTNVHGVVDQLGAISLGNHLDQTTTWHDPRTKSLSTTALNSSPIGAMSPGHSPQQQPSPQQQQQSPQQPPPPQQPQQQSPNVSLLNLGPLPSGWEQASTPAGEVYFINHNDRTTSWFDPRIPKHLQKPGIKITELQNQLGGVLPPHPLPQQPPPPTLPAPTASQQQQQQQQQQSPVRQQQPGSQISPPPPGRTPSNEHVRLELLRLQRERDVLIKRQREIAQQVWNKENMLKEVMSGVVTPTSQSGEMMNVTTSGVDPFLGQANNTEPSHPRQNSADSGLGGMGTSISLPRTPEDFLSNLEEMDTGEGGELGKYRYNSVATWCLQQSAAVHKMTAGSSDFGLDSLPAPTSMEVGMDGGDNSTGGMDSDELVPSLQEDISSELLGADVGKMESLLTWL